MSDEAQPVSPVSTVDNAKRLLSDGTDLTGLTDQVVQRFVVVELVDDVPADASDAWIEGCFRGLVDGDPRFAQAKRRHRRQQLAQLARVRPEGSA